MRTRELRAEVFERARGWCEWPVCTEPAEELAHLHSKGMGGSKTANRPDNAMAACVAPGGSVKQMGRRDEMNDERIMEVMMDALPDLPTPGPNYTQGFVKHLAVRDQLAALRDAGYELYRPDDCDFVEVPAMNKAQGTGPLPLGFFTKFLMVDQEG